jgi:hypothetical protein
MCIKYRYFIVLTCSCIFTHDPLESLGLRRWQQAAAWYWGHYTEATERNPMNQLPSYLRWAVILHHIPLFSSSHSVHTNVDSDNLHKWQAPSTDWCSLEWAGGVYNSRQRLRSLKCHEPTCTELFFLVSVHAGFSSAVQGFLSVRISSNATCSEPVKFCYMHHISQKDSITILHFGPV